MECSRDCFGWMEIPKYETVWRSSTIPGFFRKKGRKESKKKGKEGKKWRPPAGHRKMFETHTIEK